MRYLQSSDRLKFKSPHKSHTNCNIVGSGDRGRLTKYVSNVVADAVQILDPLDQSTTSPASQSKVWPAIRHPSIHRIQRVCRIMPLPDGPQHPNKVSPRSTTVSASANAQPLKPTHSSHPPRANKPYAWQKTNLIGIKSLTKELLQRELGITAPMAWEQFDMAVFPFTLPV